MITLIGQLPSIGNTSREEGGSTRALLLMQRAGSVGPMRGAPTVTVYF